MEASITEQGVARAKEVRSEDRLGRHLLEIPCREPTDLQRVVGYATGKDGQSERDADGQSAISDIAFCCRDAESLMP